MQRVEGEKAERTEFCKSKAMRTKSGILKWKNDIKALAMVICLTLTMPFVYGCGTTEPAQSTTEVVTNIEEKTQEQTDTEEQEKSLSSTENATTATETFDFASVPAYDGKAYVAVNDNVPFFTEEELSSASYETYGELDSLGRCTVCVASVGQDLMPTEERGNIGAVKPTGWHTVKYDFVDGKYLYNRCHLIGYQLTGENANEKNLITGTRYLNIEGMLPFENMVADYVKETNQHVMYRVTPVFEGDNLLAAGVLMEGKSVEDNGEGVLFCVFAYNVQPGVSIDYATGESSADGTIVNDTSVQEETQQSADTNVTQQETSQSAETQTYVLNTNTHKFHKPGCYSVEKIKPENYAEFTGTREEAIAYGYDPCKNCNP